MSENPYKSPPIDGELPQGKYVDRALFETTHDWVCMSLLIGGMSLAGGGGFMAGVIATLWLGVSL